ncbi:MAG: 2,3-bisphosphoglycerate-independent phosphoglycerate mutase [candidate division Zixibacteria bacterium]|nr:2,3-bisphosphoglycerate-independent phosphoglycerate mutase [candidate division Zixibacteria bacterium]
MFLLCILDGFGLRTDPYYNAVVKANKPNLIKLFQSCPNIPIEGSGLAVGLPMGQMGNSEVGHLNFGAGRIVYQDVTRIDKSISDGDFFTNAAFLWGMKTALNQDSSIHLFGLVSDGCVHSSMEHLKALVTMAKDVGLKKVYLHAFMDGRDTPPNSGAGYIKEMVDFFNQTGVGKVATVMGRYYGMDRDKRWERTEKAYQAIVKKIGPRFDNPVAAIEESYRNYVTDEFIIPAVMNLGDEEEGKLRNGDVALFFNFRADRVRQLSYIFAGRQYDGYPHPDNPKVHLITMTNYDVELKEAQVAYPPVHLTNIFGEVISRHGLRQLRIAETEKYAHVTYFFNGGVEKPFENEDRVMIQSPKVATYDLKPEMSSVEVADETVRRILSRKYDVVILNFANCDMVGHSGIFEAAVKAVEAIDAGVGKVIRAVEEVQGQAIITADHGNAEQMFDPETNGPFTAHTTNPVPFIFYDCTNRLGKVSLREGGILADVAPTILQYLNINQPAQMTGQSLLIPGEIPAVKH